MTSRPRVALVTCDAYPKLYEDDLLLAAALEELGIGAVPSVWSDPSIDWRGFDALVIRSPWDYFIRAAEFRSWLDARIASGVLMCNAADILDWNYDKRYLQDLEAAGMSLVPTICIARGEKADVAALARARGWNEIVVKPTISGGAYRTYRFFVDEAAAYTREIEQTLEDRGVLVQPYLDEIVSDGELSMLFFDGVFSHAVCKRPSAGDYRVQFQYGGTSETVEVEPSLVAQARACVLAAPSLPVYARVDGLVKDGQFLLMELEAFEPLMFLNRHPEAAAKFARAVQGRLAPKRAVDLTFRVDDLSGEAIRVLVSRHLRGMHDNSPPQSVHALDVGALRGPGVTFWSAWSGATLAGMGALKELDPRRGELKSMRVADELLGRGVGRAILEHIVAEARKRGMTSLWLETGSAPAFTPALRLYESAGFVRCGPFDGYADDPFSIFMTTTLSPQSAARSGSDSS